MALTILEEFETLRSAGRSSERIIAQYVETQNDDPGTTAFCEQYQQMVDQLRGAWGEPMFAGLGPRAGYEHPGPGAIACSDYSNAIRFAWWQTSSDDVAILLTGHDADTLLFIWIAVSDRK